MRRLPSHRCLQALISEQRAGAADIDRLVSVLADFYRRSPAVDLAPREHLARFQREQAVNREVLLRPQFQLRGAAAALDGLDEALHRHAALLGDRAAGGHVVDGHGDLRPEHVWMVEPPVVIDCLEFNAALRQVDPFDEIAFLAMECELAGAPWIARRLLDGCAAALADQPPPGLLCIYTAHRALLRARLAMAHLLDPEPAAPQRWPARAQRHVDHASRALARLRKVPGAQNV